MYVATSWTEKKIKFMVRTRLVFAKTVTIGAENTKEVTRIEAITMVWAFPTCCMETCTYILDY